MLTWKEVAILFLVTLIPFSLYLTTDRLAGNDGYAFLNHVCDTHPIPGQSPGIYPILELIPCNILAIKLILFGLAFSCVCILALTGKLLFKEKGYLAGVLFWLSPLLLSEFVKFENDQFAYPLIFLAFYFYIKSLIWVENLKAKFLGQNQVLSIACLVVAGLIWRGSIYMLLAFAFSGGLYLMAGLLAVGIFWQGILGNALPAWEIYESTALLGLSLLGLLLVGVVGLKYLRVKIVGGAVFTLLLAALSAKFTILALPFLTLGMVRFWLDERAGEIKKVLAGVLVLFIVFFSTVPQTYPPQERHFSAIKKAIEIDDDGRIWNDWEMGYWVEWLGGQTESKGHYSFQEEFRGTTVSKKDLNCQMLDDFEGVYVYDCDQIVLPGD